MSKLVHKLLQGGLLVLQIAKHFVLPPEYAAAEPYLSALIAYAQAHLAIYNHSNPPAPPKG